MSRAVALPSRMGEKVTPSQLRGDGLCAHRARGWGKPVWMSSRLLLLVWVAVLVYGSLLPFDLDGKRFAGWTAFMTSPGWVTPVGQSQLGISTWVSDAAMNLALYLPLGVLLRLSFRNGGWRRAVLCVLAAAGLSWLLECMQSLSASRYAALQDVMMNTLGATVGVAVAKPLLRVERGAVFWLFRKLALPLFAMVDAARALRNHPVWMSWAAAVGLLLMAGACVWLLPTAGDHGPGMNLLPFEWHFELPYDVAALLLGRSLIVYGLLGAVASLAMWRGRSGWIVTTVAVFVTGMELLRWTTGAAADVTEPILALVGVGLGLTGIYLLIHAVRCSCRREQQVAFDGVDRRRRTHDYSFRVA